MSQDSVGIAQTHQGGTICAVFAFVGFGRMGAPQFANGRACSCLTRRRLGALLLRRPAARRLAMTVTMLAAITASNRAVAQLVFDPSSGFLTQTLNQSAPILGSTETFPPFTTSGLGFAGAPASYAGIGFGGAPVGGIVAGNPPPAAVPTRLTTENRLLPPIVPGAVPIQAGNAQAPALIVSPSIALLTGFDDNPRQTQNRLADSVTILNPGLIVSADTPHLQGVLTSSFEYLKYARATDQDITTAAGSGYGLATIAPDHLFIDGRGSIFQVSPAGNGGFANPQLNSFVAPQTVLTTSITPVSRESFGDLIETDLRYNHGTVSPIGSLSSTSSSAIAATETNQGSLTVALGKGGGTLSSRLVLSAADIASQSDAASTQTRGITELQYRFNPEVALIARGGYENLRFANAGLAFSGPVATLGTRLDLTPTSAINVRYGREEGTWGFNGAVFQALTPRTLLLLSYQHSLGSQQEQILSNLNASRLDPYGNIVDAETSLPLALVNPELAFNQTGVFRIERASAALEHEFETDSLRLFAFYEKQSALSAGTFSNTARGAQIAWFRTMTPTMKGALSLGYASETGNQLLSVGFSLIMNLRSDVDAVLSYQFTDSMSDSARGTTVPSFTRNFLIAGIRASF